MRRADKAALWTAAALASWSAVALNLIVWEGLPLIRHWAGWHMSQINYQLSTWPVLVDLVILMATMALTRQQMRQSDAQATMLEALHRILETMQQYDRADSQDLDAVVAFIDQIGADFPAKLAAILANHERLKQLMDEYQAQRQETRS